MAQKLGRTHPELRWIDCYDGKIPNDAVQGGMEEDGRPLYIARSLHESSLIPGKAAAHIKGILIPYGGKEVNLERCEVLCGPANKVMWKECYGKLQVQGWAPLECGYEKDGQELYIAKSRLGSGEVLGKIGSHFASGMAYGYDCKEKYTKESDVYYVLSVPN